MRGVMDERGSGSSSGGIGFLGLLTIVFIVLKLMGYITWSWLWVLAPLWAIPGLLIGGLGAYLLVVWVGSLGTSRAHKKMTEAKKKERIASNKRAEERADEEADRLSELIKGSTRKG